MEEDTTLALVRKDLEPYGLVNIGDPDQDEPIVTLVHRMHAELEQLRNKVGTLERENTGRAALIKQHVSDHEKLSAEFAHLMVKHANLQQACKVLVALVRKHAKKDGLREDETLEEWMARRATEVDQPTTDDIVAVRWVK